MGAFHKFTEPRGADLHDAYWAAYQARKAAQDALEAALATEKEARAALWEAVHHG